MAAPDRTEKPTPQRLKKAREQGQFLVSRGFLSAMQFIVAILLLGTLVSAWRNSLELQFPRLLQRAMAGEISSTEWPTILRRAILQNLTPLLYILGALLAVTLAAHLGISKLGFSLQRLTPAFKRLNPAGKLKELPAQNIKSVLEAALLFGFLGFAVYSLLQDQAAALLRLSLEPATLATAQIGAAVKALLWKAAWLFIAFGVFDLIRQQRKYMSQLKMSKQEIKEEMKRQEGDPQIRARIRRMRRELLRRRMMQDVPKATAVIVNPTHFAVAIRYEIESMSSPMVVAKGKNWLALRIRRIAMENQIPIIENPPLARALYDAVEVGRAISPEFYKAIAEVLAYVYKMMGRTAPR
jgi:flagellar biosynthetic protein FlhB